MAIFMRINRIYSKLQQQKQDYKVARKKHADSLLQKAVARATVTSAKWQSRPRLRCPAEIDSLPDHSCHSQATKA